MRIYLIILLFVIFLFFAIFVYYLYYQRVRVYRDLKILCNSLSTNISYKKKSVGDIVALNYERLGLFTKLILKNQSLSKRFLGVDSFLTVNGFLDNMGGGDVDYELQNIEFYEKEFEEMFKGAKEDLQKKGIVYFKLLIGVGLIICIILF
ncbi:MAG: hypothetical protein E7354_01355 [Clostridiales bacterium]|nr:hypothetical protein [Clostridiales bacterium]